EQLLRDLAVRSPDGEHADDLQLAAGEAGALRVGARALAQAARDRLAERGHLLRRLGREWASAELARRAVGVAEAFEPGPPVSRGGERDPCPQLDLGSLERDVEA